MSDARLPSPCALARDRAAAYLDGELPADEARDLQAHLDGCAACRREADELAALDRDLGLLTAGPAAALEDPIRSIFEKAAAAGASSGRLGAVRGSTSRLRHLSARARHSWLQAMVAAAFLGAVALSFYALHRARARDGADLAAEGRAADARLEVERREAARRRAEGDLARAEAEKLALQHQLMEQRREEEAEAARRRTLAEAEERRRRAEEEFRRVLEQERRAREEFERAVAQSLTPRAADRPRRPDDVVETRPPERGAVATGGARPDAARVDAAIYRGVGYIKTRFGFVAGREADERLARSVELALLTYLHAGVPEADPDFQKLFRLMMGARLERTYNVALQAMVLEELDRARYQWRIAQCAQFLLDNQCRNGQWGYGDPSLFVEDIPAPPKEAVASGARKGPPSDPPALRAKARVTRLWPVLKRRDGPAAGDNSNSQYAALGLRACHDAGIQLPREGVALAHKWWRDSQQESGGWCYGGRDHGHEAYGSMTAGALASLVILDYLLNEDWRRDAHVARGMDWLGRRFTALDNPGPPEHGPGRPGWQLFYYLYAAERTGNMTGTERFGRQDWYAAGARAIVEAQRGDGSWLSKEGGQELWDTSFAILFLRKATRPLDVPSGVEKRK